MPDNAYIIRNTDNDILVRGHKDQVVKLGESRYFDPQCIDRSRFIISDRIYSCPERGTCYWVDLKTGKSYINDVAWVYPEPSQKYRSIAGWFGFYADHRYYHYREES